MSFLTFLVGGIAAAFWGGYRLAGRFPVLGSLVALLLLVGAFFIIRLGLNSAHLGDGAPAAAAAAIGLIWLVEAGSILLAGTLLVAGWRSQGHPLSQALFLFLFLPFSAYAVWSALPTPRPAARPVEHDAGGKIEPGTWKDGYIRAIDSQFVDETECRNGTPDYLTGCKLGVSKNRARQGQ